jgi:hypothetical protein
MTRRAGLWYWLSVFAVLTATSLGFALWLTRPGDDRDRMLAVLAYVGNPRLGGTDAELTAPVKLTLADPDARAFRVEFQPQRVPQVAVIAFSDARDCRPNNDIDGAASPLPPNVLHANVLPTSYAASMSAFLLRLSVTDATFVCTLAHGARASRFFRAQFRARRQPALRRHRSER